MVFDHDCLAVGAGDVGDAALHGCSCCHGDAGEGVSVAGNSEAVTWLGVASRDCGWRYWRWAIEVEDGEVCLGVCYGTYGGEVIGAESDVAESAVEAVSCCEHGGGADERAGALHVVKTDVRQRTLM